MVRIRPITDADIDEIARVHARTWQAAYAGIVPQEVLDALDPVELAEIRRTRKNPPGAATIVAEADDGALVGFANYGPDRADDAYAQLYALYVDPDHWSTGAGRALMDAVKQALAGREVRLWVLEDNRRARRFYELAGFTADGARDLFTPRDSEAELPQVRYSARL
jgi:GNAT superfamily N-acetyltransferase